MRAYPAAATPQAMTGPDPEMAACLDDALASKLVSALRGRHHHFLAKLHGFAHAAEVFLAHSKLEQDHADLLADRIVELEAQPGFSPHSLIDRGQIAHFPPCTDAIEMSHDELDAAHASAGMLAKAVQLAGTRDLASRRLLMTILDVDQRRVKELTTLMVVLKGKKTGGRKATAS